MNMVTMTVYLDAKAFSYIVNTLNHDHDYSDGKMVPVSLKKTKNNPYEVQVPIQIVGSFLKKDMSKISLSTLLELKKEGKNLGFGN